ncbi:UDP-N-acetylenolpyruvoylglucosamine reductase [Bacteroidales bacterium]|nr:UDP-N-acetylenolpyruvoylglucosamine reductase [Bacteroidales bacterium]
MIRIEENYCLLEHNTFGIDVKTRWFIEYGTEEDLSKILRDEYFFSLAFRHIGQGSNLLFLGDYDGLILHSVIKDIEIVEESEEEISLKVGAGMVWDDLVAYCVNNNWGGIENLSLIPGEVGASAVQNIGAYGVEVSERIIEVHAYNIETQKKCVFSNADCRFAYRQSIFKTEAKGCFFITHVVFKLDKRPKFNTTYDKLKDFIDQESEITLKSIRQSVIKIRESKLPDPKVQGNAGSYFMNPYVGKNIYESLLKKYPTMPHYPISDTEVKVPAAWMIEQCGMKGTRFGQAGVHDKQALVLVNLGGATGDEIALLAEEVRRKVVEMFGIELQPEVNYL